MPPAVGSGATTSPRTGTAPTSPSPTTGAAPRRSSANGSASCPFSLTITSPSRWRRWRDPSRALIARATTHFGDQIREGKEPLGVAHVQAFDHATIDGDDALPLGLSLLVCGDDLAR